jgi:decaprenylphospho-beta-D-erythro-pentofuranosid-2-ulose 2-reductase
MMQRILIFGATSAIAEAAARLFAARGDALALAGRSGARLQAIADDLKLRGAAVVDTLVIDAREFDRFPALLQAASERLGGLDAALIAHGTLSDQAACQGSVELLRQEFDVNAFSFMALCTHLATRFEAQGHGVIAVISSVAGDRGRQSNYAYGSAKAAVTAFTSGLRQRLYPKGVRVVTIKPGFVSTPMTAAFRKGLLWATPQRVAADIVRAMDGGKAVIYTPWFWRPIMWIIRSVPETMFRRLRL